MDDLISRKAVKENHQKWLGYLDEDMIARLDIAVDKHIPSAFEGMTNGEVLQAIISGLKPIVLSNETGAIYFDWDWWNTPYKEKE